MYHQEFESPEILKDAVKCFWYNSQEFGEEQTAFEVTPDGYAEIIFHFGSGCSILNNGELQQLPSPFMMGLLNRPVTFYAKNRLEIIGVRFFPWMIFDLLELPSEKNSVHIFKHPVAELQPMLNEFMQAGKIDDAINYVKDYFLQAKSQIKIDSMLYKAGIAMQKANGTLPVNKVAAAAHATVRTLERNFKQSSGHTVKDVSALMRFEQVRNQLWLHPDSNLAGLAQEFGYADQSHLSKEFKRFSGATPAAFARKSKQRKQVLDKDFVAFIQA